MRIRYTSHAATRLEERNVSKREVKEALQKGRKRLAQDGLMECSYKIPRGSLVLIYNVMGAADYQIITVYWQ
jgi:hypothetical protein